MCTSMAICVYVCMCDDGGAGHCDDNVVKVRIALSLPMFFNCKRGEVLFLFLFFVYYAQVEVGCCVIHSKCEWIESVRYSNWWVGE